jgi:hypothetical protein
MYCILNLNCVLIFFSVLHVIYRILNLNCVLISYRPCRALLHQLLRICTGKGNLLWKKFRFGVENVVLSLFTFSTG